VAKHFKKMFAGLSGVLMDDDNNIVGFTSKEGEEVRLKKEVNLVKTPRINDWLTAIETNMKLTLAELLAEAVAGQRWSRQLDWQGQRFAPGSWRGSH
jgi:dynein heavy chain 1